MTPGTAPWRAALTLALVALVGLGGLLGLRALTAERIAGQERARERAALARVLPPALHDNIPDEDRILLLAPGWLGSEAALPLRRARREGEASAFVIEAVAPDGYNGDIRLLLAASREGELLGLRVLEHRETPGLGDGIDPERGDWSRQLQGRSLRDPPPVEWRLRQEGGAFDALAGATLSSRAALGAVRRALQLVERHGEALAAAPAGSTLRLDDAPEALR